MRIIEKPHPGEYPAYASMYIDLLPSDGRLLEHLRVQFDEIRDYIYSLSEDQLLYRPSPDKWNIREILVHIIDDERIYAYRALSFARGDITSLPGFDQDLYAQNSRASDRPLDSIFREYSSVRNSTIDLFEGLPDEAFMRKGTGDGNKATVRALAYHIAGHELHHFNIIRERYVNVLDLSANNLPNAS